MTHVVCLQLSGGCELTVVLQDFAAGCSTEMSVSTGAFCLFIHGFNPSHSEFTFLKAQTLYITRTYPHYTFPNELFLGRESVIQHSLW